MEYEESIVVMGCSNIILLGSEYPSYVGCYKKMNGLVNTLVMGGCYTLSAVRKFSLLLSVFPRERSNTARFVILISTELIRDCCFVLGVDVHRLSAPVRGGESILRRSCGTQDSASFRF